jgi:hypothetical protein
MALSLEHDGEKWEPVFGQDHAQTSNIPRKSMQVLAAGAVDLRRAIGDSTALNKTWVGVMKWIVTAGLLAAFAGCLLAAESAQAQTAAPGVRVAQATPDYVPSRRKNRRVFIYPREHFDPDVYPRYNPGPNAVRECNAHYVQEVRPSGTVITPRMHCYWRPG